MKDCNKTGMTECPNMYCPQKKKKTTRDARPKSTCATKLSLLSFSISFAL